MHVEFFQSTETSFAAITIVRFVVSAVRPHVRLQARIEFEFFTAYRAQMLALIAVHRDHVMASICVAAKRFRAHITNVWSFAGVDACMFAQPTHSGKRFIAMLAPKRTFAGVQ